MENGQASHTPFFSIVMPVYNVERYITDALDCIVAQTFADWELIVVDDASLDSSMKLVEKFAQHDMRIRIISHSNNLGAAAARNTGMDAARGLYVWFADADDAVDTDLLARVKIEIDQTAAQIVLFGLIEQYFDSSDKLLYCNEIPLRAVRYADPQDWHDTIIDLEQSTHFGYTYNKVYELSFLREHQVRFQNLLLAEDFVFNVDSFRNAKRISLIEGAPYLYRKVDGRSATNSNNYTYLRYYRLMRMRIEVLRELLIEWAVFDSRARAILGSLYGRYVLSAIERTYHSNAQITKQQRFAFIQEVMDDSLYRELIPSACARDSKITAIGLKVLRLRNAKIAAYFGKLINFSRVHMYSLFTKFRSGR